MAQVPPEHSHEIADIERQRDTLREQQGRYQRALEALYHVSIAARSTTSFRTIFEEICRELCAIFPLDACYIAVCDTNQPDLFRAAYMYDEGLVEYVEQTPHGRLTGMLLSRREPILFRDLAAERLPAPQPIDRFGNPLKFSRSWIGAPLLIDSNVIGVISVQNYQPNLFTEADLDLLQRLSNIIGVALENINLAQQQRELSQTLAQRVKARNDELAILSGLADEVVLRRPLIELLEHALSLILPLLNVKAGNVRLYDRANNTLVLLAQHGIPADDTRAVTHIPTANHPIGNIIADNRPVIIPRALAKHSHLSHRSIFEALLSVPLRIGDQVIGSLTLLDTEPHHFDAEQVEMVQIFGNQIALAIENARLLEERERQITELRALSQISYTAATALDMRTLLRQVHAALSSFMQLDAFLMIAYDPERQIITEGVGIDEGREQLYMTNQPAPPHSFSAWVLREKRILHLRDVSRELPHYPEVQRSAGNTGRNAESWLGAPLFDRAGQSIGVLSVQCYRPEAFRARDERFLEEVARQVALHMQNVQLLADRDRRIRELDAIGRIGQLVSASYDLEQMLQQVYEQLQALTHAPVFYMVICEPESWIITHSTYIENGVREPDNWRGDVPAEGSLTSWVLRHQQALLLHDMLTQREELAAMGIATHRFSSDHSTRAWVGVPLLAKEGQPIGIISVQDFEPNQYDQRTVMLLNQVASHLSLGIQKVRLFEERERQIAENARLFVAEQAARHMADTLREVAHVLSSSFDPDEVPHIILRELRKIIPYDTASILLLQEEYFRLAMQGKSATTEVPPLMSFHIDDLNAAKLVVNRREPLLIGDITTSPEWSPITTQTVVRTWLGAPLIAKGQVIGVLNISAAEPNRFTERDAEVAFAFASQAAIAMENARLYQESVTRVEQELEIAGQIQRNLFPQTLPHVKGLDLAAICLPARETGGDFYDVVLLDDEVPSEAAALALIIGDASGKSIPAAMLMAVARSIVRSEARDHRTPQKVMRETNRWIALDVPQRSFVALCYATLDIAQRRLALANAGQLAPIHRQYNGHIRYLEAPGNTLPLGIQPNTPYDTLELPLDPGDLLLFYTDGIVEAKNYEHKLFGFDRLEELVRIYGHLPADELIASIVHAIRRFVGDTPQHDDMTVMAIRFLES